jgi:DNA adenine methylase
MLNCPSPIQPLFKLVGGKRTSLASLALMFPPRCRTYIEPFVGAGAVFLSINPDRVDRVIINDRNSEFIHLYRFLRDEDNAAEQLVAALDAMAAKPTAETFAYYRKYIGTGAERAARVIYLSKLGFNGLYRVNSKGEYNVPFGKREICPSLFTRANVDKVCKFMQSLDISITNSDFVHRVSDAQLGDVLYCDPPYWATSTTAQFAQYTAEGFSWDDQVRLHNAAVDAAKRGAQVFVSNSNCDAIRQLYQGHEIHEISRSQNVSASPSSRKSVSDIFIRVLP